ncbi:MAG: AMP-binding protein [Alphaproteobacteria bacterium]
MNANLYALFQSRFPADRAAPFIEMPDGRIYRYADLDDQSARYAALLLGLGLKPGDRVAVQVEKSPEAVFLYAACLRAGLAYLPLNTAYPPPELDYFIGNAEPGAIVARPEHEAALAAIARQHGVRHVLTLGAAGEGSLPALAAATGVDPILAHSTPGETAAILYSSGTTGRPKGAMLSHHNLASNGLALHRAWGFRPNDVLLHALPIFHAHGLFVALHTTLLNGTGMIFCPKFDPAEILRLLPKATVFMGVPTLYERLLLQPGLDRARCAHMRLFISGSAPLLESTFTRFREQTGHTILERYGMTETGMNTSNPLDGERRGGTVGFALPGVSVRIVGADGRPVATGETGELQVKGDTFGVLLAHAGQDGADFHQGWLFRTGDLAAPIRTATSPWSGAPR